MCEEIKLEPCPFCDRADVDGVTDWAERIRKAVG